MGLGEMASTGRNSTRGLSSNPFFRSSCILDTPFDPSAVMEQLVLISIFYHKKIKRKLDSVAVVENPVEKLKKEGLAREIAGGEKGKKDLVSFLHIIYTEREQSEREL